MKFPSILLRSQMWIVSLVLAFPLEQGSNSLIARSGQEMNHIRHLLTGSNSSGVMLMGLKARVTILVIQRAKGLIYVRP